MHSINFDAINSKQLQYKNPSKVIQNNIKLFSKVFFEFNAMYGEALRCNENQRFSRCSKIVSIYYEICDFRHGETATPSTSFCERSERIEFFKINSVVKGDLQYA